jgi:hypothetical protein
LVLEIGQLFLLQSKYSTSSRIHQRILSIIVRPAPLIQLSVDYVCVINLFSFVSIEQSIGLFTVPVAQPTVSLTVYNTTALLVEWSEVPRDRARGKITHYQVHYRWTDSASRVQAGLFPPTVVVTTNSDVRQYVINGIHLALDLRCLVS